MTQEAGGLFDHPVGGIEKRLYKQAFLQMPKMNIFSK
jgi:hypothetical protein